MEKKKSYFEVLREYLRKISNKFLRKIYQSKIISIAIMELSSLVPTKKFLGIFIVMLFPVIVGNFPAIENVAKMSVENFVREYEKNVGGVILSFWTGLPGQIIAIMISSEYIAGEFDKETLKLLFTKPIKKADIIFGKLLSFITSMLIVMIPTMLLYTGAFVLIYEKGYDEFIAIFSESYWIGLGIILLGLIFVASIGLVISSVMKRPLYAALAAIIFLIGIQLFIGLIPFVKEPTHYTFTYQLGVILEEVYYLSDTNLYKGDPYAALTFFIAGTIVNLIITEIALIKKEVP
ncbi:MAG: ABC transporter permease [Candidatus Asgardarchaeia archaeon]